MFGFLHKPTPVWFSLIRLAVIAAVLVWIGTDAVWMPVAEETAATVAEVRKQLSQANAAAAVHEDIKQIQFNEQAKVNKEPQHGNDIAKRQ